MSNILYLHAGLNGCWRWIQDKKGKWKTEIERTSISRGICGIAKLNGAGIYLEIDMETGKVLNWNKEQFLKDNPEIKL